MGSLWDRLDFINGKSNFWVMNSKNIILALMAVVSLSGCITINVTCHPEPKTANESTIPDNAQQPYLPLPEIKGLKFEDDCKNYFIAPYTPPKTMRLRGNN